MLARKWRYFLYQNCWDRKYEYMINIKTLVEETLGWYSRMIHTALGGVVIRNRELAKN